MVDEVRVSDIEGIPQRPEKMRSVIALGAEWEQVIPQLSYLSFPGWH